MRVTSVRNIIDNKPLRYVAVVAIALAVFAIISICLHRRTTLSTNVSPKVNDPDVTKSQSKGLPHAIATVFTSRDSRTDSELLEWLGLDSITDSQIPEELGCDSRTVSEIPEELCCDLMTDSEILEWLGLDSRTDPEIREKLGIPEVQLIDADFEPTHTDTPLSAKPM
ncbi:MAG: hypothetical protein H7A39_03895 [Chlamydiales bacterium]|nr:hypothetical protein [Chlamydiales bacterium]